MRALARIHTPTLGCLLLLAALLAAGAAAQRMGAHAPRPSPLRPLHVRVAEADAAAVATIEAVELGRIRATRNVALLGEPGASFEIKRAPSRPPPLKAGDLALLLLRGARSPYVLADAPEELLVLAGPAAVPRWQQAFRELSRSAPDPARLLDVYLRWLEGKHADLREAGRVGLVAADAPYQPLPAPVVQRLVGRALDAGLTLSQRRAATDVALRQPGGVEPLLAALPGDAETADPVILRAAIQAGGMRRSGELGPLLARCLAHPRADVRRAGLSASAFAANDPEALPALERVAREDPETELREEAQRALARKRRREARD